MNLHQFMAVGVQSCRGEYEYIHNGKARTSTAFEIKEKAEIFLKIPRSLGTLSAVFELYSENESSFIREISGEWQGFCGEYDEYIFNIPCESIGIGLYFLRPRLSVFGGCLFGHKWAGEIYFNTDPSIHSMMQLSLCDFAFVEPKKIRGGVIYHIFVDRFRRGGKKEVPDGAKIIPGNWRVIPEYPEYPGAPLHNNTFWGGTLWGIIEKLDYIKSFGTTAIYLSPIFKASSNHKYDTADYMTVDPIFGGDRALSALIKACAEKDIELILDGVFNHTGADSIYFNRYGRYKETGAYQSKKSKYYDWYEFKTFPKEYTSWWGIDILPRINPDIPSCGEYFVGENGVIDKYSKMGIYGFRLDVADELSDVFISRIKDRLSKNRSENILYGEVWEDASNKISYGRRKHYYLGNELDGVMNYPIRLGIIDYLLGRGCEKLAYALTDISNNAPEHIIHNQMNLLGTHDTERILTTLGGEKAEGKTNATLAKLRMSQGQKRQAIQRLICAYTILATIPGIPTIFYGDEAGLEGYSDPFNRMPYPWGKEEHLILHHYKTIGKIRTSNSVYKSGDFKLNLIEDETLVFTRNDGHHAFITFVNNSDQERLVSFDKCATELISEKQSDSFKTLAYSAYIFMVELNTAVEIS